jgi:hypothetical protein
MITVVVRSAIYETVAGWFVLAFVDDAHGTRVASYQLDLPDTSDEAALIAAIAALFE